MKPTRRKDVAEALAVSWREKRKEITKMQRSRKFGAANDLKRSYRVEIEELKRKNEVPQVWPSWPLVERVSITIWKRQGTNSHSCLC